MVMSQPANWYFVSRKKNHKKIITFFQGKKKLRKKRNNGKKGPVNQLGGRQGVVHPAESATSSGHHHRMKDFDVQEAKGMHSVMSINSD